MRSLTSTLLAAQKSASGSPFVRVQVRERIGNIVRLRWERLYTGSEPDTYHALTVPGDASLVRARVASGTLYYQRVAGPGPGSDFSSWTSLGSVAQADVALASRGSTVLLFYVDTDGVTIRVRESQDYGATLGSPVTVATAAGAVGWLAAALKSDGTALLLYSVGGTVYAVKRSGGTWGDPAPWTNSAATIAGLACVYYGDFNVAAAGTNADGDAKLWTTIYGDGLNQPVGVWSSLKEVAAADVGSGVSFRAPFLDRPDTFRLFFVEEYTGTQAYSRPLWSYFPASQDFVAEAWREPVPFDLSSQYGMALAHDSTWAWLATPSGVWRASLSAPPLDLTADVLEVGAESESLRGRLKVVLRNDHGRFSDLGSSELTAIRYGSQVALSPGYATTAGQEVSAGPLYWLDGWTHHTGGASATFTLHASDAWSLVEGWRSRRQYTWAAGQQNIFQILRFIFGRAGLEFSSLGSSSALTGQQPSFTIHPGESGLTAVRRLLAMVPDVLRVAGEYVYIFEPLADQSADYAYGTDHAILRGRYGSPGLAVNRVQVFGQGLMVEDFRWDALADEYDRLRQAHDLNLTTVARAQERAAAEFRAVEIESYEGELLVPMNCGQELYDVVSLTDAGAGLSAAGRRVLGMAMRYDRHGPRPTYELALRLGAP